MDDDNNDGVEIHMKQETESCSLMFQQVETCLTLMTPFQSHFYLPPGVRCSINRGASIGSLLRVEASI